jgi:hypothetical protein
MCDSPAGMLMARAISPMSKFTGGIIPPFCSPIPTAGELLDPGAIGANSKVKMDKANAEKRKKAVEEMANVDCHWFPEVQDALIGALRADRNECVRHTAAIALQKGCCCTPKTITALTICVSGSEEDGNPCENSPRVRAAAAVALELCLERACCPVCPIPEGAVPVEEKKQEEKPKGEEPKKEGTSQSSAIAWTKAGPEDETDAEAAARKASKAFYEKAKKQKMDALLKKARHALDTMPPLPIDLSIPQGNSDYQAAGVKSMTNADGSSRPANVYDMLIGRQGEPSRVQAAPIMPKSAIVKASVEAPIKTEPVKATVEPPAAKPVKAIVEPPAAKPAVKVKVEDTPWPAPVPTKPTAPATMAVPTPMPVKVEAAPISKSPVPAFMPAAKPVELVPITAPAAPQPKPAEFVIPKAMPASATSNATKVIKMLDEPSDLGQLRLAIDSLSAADMKEQPKLTPVLLKAAEYPSDSGLRLACLKAVVRGKAKSQDVASGFERISHDHDPAVAGEAARLLKELRAGN